MSRIRKIEIVESSPPFFLTETTSIFTPKTLTVPHCFFPSLALEDDLDFAFDLLQPTPKPALIDFTSPFDSITDLIQIDRTPFYTSTRRVEHRLGPDSYLQTLCDRVSALELTFDRLVNAKPTHVGGDRKYTWTAEIKSTEKSGVDKKYKWTAEIKGDKKKKKKEEKVIKGGVEKSYKWTAEIKDKDAPITKTYTFQTSTGESEKKEKKEKKNKSEKVVAPTRVVEIEEPNSNHGVVVLKQAFARRGDAAEKCKGKRKELTPQDAAIMIQITFRAYLIKRSKALRALRELAVAKTKLKEIRSLFNNFTYRRRVSRDAEERQRFSEKIIVLLITVDSIEGADLMVRTAKRSMVDELEAMLDVVDPQPAGKSLSMRRTFDMPDGVIQRELAAGVAEVVQMFDQENGTFEACL